MAQDEELATIGIADPDITSSISVRELGYNGLSVLSGQILEECNPELVWPRCIWTYKKMLHDSTIATAVNMFNAALADVPWYIKAPKGYEEDLAGQVRYLETLRHDMEHSWLAFIKQALSYVWYGYAPFEIVGGKRLKAKGSKYNDGYFRLRKLSLRTQDSISGWDYKNKGRDLNGMWQLVNKPQSRQGNFLRPYQPAEPVKSDGVKTEQFIPIGKLLLFRNNPLKDSPIGVSPFNSIYKSFKYKLAYEENMAHGVVSDVHGLKTLYLPIQYMLEDATPEDAAVYEMYKKIMRNIHVGQESGIILPMVRDELKGDKQFEFEIVNSTGQKSYDVLQIIDSYKNEILTALYADFLILGQSGGGSFALSESKMSVVQIVIRSILNEIKDVLNHKLVPLIFKENKWDTDIMPTFEFGEVTETTIAEFAKAFQQVSATKGIPKTVAVINETLEKLGYTYRVPEGTTQEDLYELLDGGDSGVGEGLEEGNGSGTGKATGSSGDGGTSNSQNN